MDGGRHQETGWPQLTEGIRESRTGTMFVFNQLQSAVSFTIIIYDGCKSASAASSNEKYVTPTRLQAT